MWLHNRHLVAPPIWQIWQPGLGGDQTQALELKTSALAPARLGGSGGASGRVGLRAGSDGPGRGRAGLGFGRVEPGQVSVGLGWVKLRVGSILCLAHTVPRSPIK